MHLSAIMMHVVLSLLNFILTKESKDSSPTQSNMNETIK